MASKGSSASVIGVTGLKQVRDKLGRFTAMIETHPLEILLEEAPRIEAEAKLLVPIDSHTLQSSIHATVERRGKTKAILTLSASAVNRGYDYAKIQHENTEYNHPNGGEDHYLSKPYFKGRQRITDRIKEEVRYDK